MSAEGGRQKPSEPTAEKSSEHAEHGQGKKGRGGHEMRQKDNFLVHAEYTADESGELNGASYRQAQYSVTMAGSYMPNVQVDQSRSQALMYAGAAGSSRSRRCVAMKIKAYIDCIDLRCFRFWLQLASFALLVYGGRLAIDLGNSLPTFSCGYNKKGLAGVCYLLPLQHQLAEPWSQWFSPAGLGVLGGFAIFLRWFVLLNKAWCGFICPLGTIQDWITSLRKLFGIRYSTYNDDQFKKLTLVKYVLLLALIFMPLAIGGQLLSHDWATPYCQLCPARMIIPVFNGDFSQWLVDFSSTGKMVLTALGMFVTGLFLIGSFLKKRFFCFFCPMGAFHYIFSKLALFKLKKEGSKCTVCGDCYRVCDLQIKPIADNVVKKDILMDDCILCLKYVAACPEQGALRVDFLGRTVFESTKDGFVKRMGLEKKE